MAYTPTIPQPSDRPNNSQPLISDNFDAINTVNSVNHVEFNDGDAGKHKFLTMPEQATEPVPGALTNEVILYSKDSAYPAGTTVLAYKNEAGTIYEVGSGGASAQHSWSILPSGALFKWGYLNWSTTDAQAVSLAIPFTTSPKLQTVNCITFQPVLLGGFLDANIMFKGLNAGFAANQQVDLYVSKFSTDTKPTSNFNFYYSIIGTSQ